MKKTLLFIIFIFTVSTTMAQHWIGVRGGYVKSNVSFDKFSYRKTEPYSGKNFGISYLNHIEDFMGLQVELNLTERGFNYKEQDTSYIRRSLEMPLLANFRVDIGSFMFFLNAGCYVGHTLNKYKHTKNDTTSNKISVDFNDRDNRLEFGIAGGGGLGVYITKKIAIMAEARLSQSMTYLFKPVYKNETRRYIRPKGTQFSLSILYKIAKRTPPKIEIPQ